MLCVRDIVILLPTVQFGITEFGHAIALMMVKIGTVWKKLVAFCKGVNAQHRFVKTYLKKALAIWFFDELISNVDCADSDSKWRENCRSKTYGWKENRSQKRLPRTGSMCTLTASGKSLNFVHRFWQERNPFVKKPERDVCRNVQHHSINNR